MLGLRLMQFEMHQNCISASEGHRTEGEGGTHAPPFLPFDAITLSLRGGEKLHQRKGAETLGILLIGLNPNCITKNGCV